MLEYLSIFLGIDIDEMIDDILNENCKLLNKLKKKFDQTGKPHNPYNRIQNQMFDDTAFNSNVDEIVKKFFNNFK